MLTCSKTDWVLSEIMCCCSDMVLRLALLSDTASDSLLLSSTRLRLSAFSLLLSVSNTVLDSDSVCDVSVRSESWLCSAEWLVRRVVLFLVKSVF